MNHVIESPVIDKETYKAKVRLLLQWSGWSPCDLTAIAIRTFPTVVGPKSALVYLQDYGKATQNYLLTGDYPSEGRNALESCFVMLPKNASEKELSRLTKQFAADAARVIAGTYAASLLNGRLKPRALLVGPNGSPAIEWWRLGVASCNEPSVVTVVTEYRDEADRVLALGLPQD
ncbi:hypothetical protein os4_37140 (plasmid) [Comamonadaceae bacterium OS-4]|nr:hypothetical protein os4_37140 [Comamonadaceae bacterium OS-4]